MNIQVKLLKTKMGEESFQKLMEINNPQLNEFIARYVELCNPDKVFVCDDSPEDFQYIRQRAIKSGEEKKLSLEGQTIHFDGYHDQARDKKNTKILLPSGTDLGKLNSIDREEGLAEIHNILKDIMKGHRMYVMLLCLGPQDSEFAIPCVQLTNSACVAHNEILLFRAGYQQFRKLEGEGNFFKFIHSAGELDKNMVSTNIDERRIYIDLENNTVYSTNTQYGGNAIGLKKLAMRLSMKKGSKEGWLTEHMFIMGIHGPNDRVTYFTGAFPSMCGKTSTAMIEGETIVGDDITYLRVIDGKIRAANVERGIFGIIKGVNSKDDPIIYKALTTPGEVIFSNILEDDSNNPYWIGKDGEIPKEGVNYSGKWFPGKKNDKGDEITPSHKNARFTVAIDRFGNKDPNINDSKGVEVGGIIYGGRDTDTTVPVEQSFDWEHGILTKGATIESETTAATLGEEGVRKFNLMSNLDFISIPLGRYIQNNLDMGRKVDKPPLIFSVNYFLKDKNGEYLNDKEDKRIWLRWMGSRCHGDVDAIKTPTGYIPTYKDLKRLFTDVFNKNYAREEYIEQFTIRVPELLAKIYRIEEIYKSKVPDTPSILFRVLEEQSHRLEKAQKKHGDYISPLEL